MRAATGWWSAAAIHLSCEVLTSAGDAAGRHGLCSTLRIRHRGITVVMAQNYVMSGTSVQASGPKQLVCGA